jgi:pimeloyl-ACP methyl ester carboxylesterase
VVPLLVVAVAAATAAWAFGGALAVQIAAGAATVLFLMALESGSLERLSWRRVPTKGEPLLDALAKVPPETLVWFVGHSLGGALATLGFAAWRNRCEHLSKQADGKSEAARIAKLRIANARLVTFASPLVGDARFVGHFIEQHEGHFRHVVYQPDPVPSSPPPSPRHLLRTAREGLLSFLGLLLLLASAFWARVYPALWEGQTSYATWDKWDEHGNAMEYGGLVRLRARWNWMCLFRHTRGSYRKRL